ncbi:hypothetical protein CASFOL_039048 [Castilleja foliolosa]|uniref:Uncharacterized protein n=1 Tax=Castilleja foliolosa TaxID=1961234 RepID=A0ABD3BHG9_9LAMI
MITMKKHSRRFSDAYIYSTFGSSAPYTISPDSKPFLNWLRKEGIIVGIISNAEYRYQDVILPALGLHKGSEWDFGVFSGLEGVEKPDPKMYEIALERAGKIAPEEALHVGDSMRDRIIGRPRISECTRYC